MSYVDKLFAQLGRRTRAYYERKEDVPAPPEKVYHASPYAREILEQGLAINPEKQTLGGHGTYVSTTNLEEALEYARDLKIVVGFINDEFGWDQLEAQLNNVGIAVGVGMAIANYATNELFRVKDYESILPADLKGKHPYSKEMQEFFKTAYFNGVDFEGNPITPEQEVKRRWETLHAGNYLQGENSRRFVLLVGSDPPEHLIGKSMNDVGVVELVHAPVATDTPASYERYTEDQTKGKYTYNEAENEWRFYDTSDLWPVRIIEAADHLRRTRIKGARMKHLSHAIQLLGAYEHLDTWEEIFNQAAQDGIAWIEAGIVQLPEDVKAKITDLAKEEFLRIVGDPAELAKELEFSKKLENTPTGGLGSIRDYIYDEAIGATKSEAYYLLEKISNTDKDYTQVLKLMERGL
jgi:hypothetical protein